VIRVPAFAVSANPDARPLVSLPVGQKNFYMVWVRSTGGTPVVAARPAAAEAPRTDGRMHPPYPAERAACAVASERAENREVAALWATSAAAAGAVD
jgi:hypothetical protein